MSPSFNSSFTFHLNRLEPFCPLRTISISITAILLLFFSVFIRLPSVGTTPISYSPSSTSSSSSSSSFTSNRTIPPQSVPKDEIQSFKVGLLMVQHYAQDAVRFDVVHIGPAIDIAENKCRQFYDVNLNIIQGYYQDSCNESNALGKAFDLLNQHQIVAFIGPACSRDLQVVGRLASYKKIPVITGLGDVLQGDRSTYTTLIRVSYDMKDEARAILAFLSQFKWYTFGLIYRLDDVYYGTLASELFKLLSFTRYRAFKCTCRETYIRASNKTVLTNLDSLMDRIIGCARIVVILGGDRDVRSMMLIAHNKGITMSGEYAFLYTELIEAEATGTIPWSRGTEEPKTKEKLKEAYQALLIVSLYQNLSASYMSFSDEVKRRALADYNYTYNEDTVNYFTASFHDSVILLCKAISDTLLLKENPLNGESLVQRMKDVTISGMSGRVAIDKEGDRIADYALLDQVNIESGIFEVVGTYDGATNMYNKVKSIHWPGKFGTKPVDVPRCGFDGKACTNDLTWNVVIGTLLGAMLFLLIIAIYVYRKVSLEKALTKMAWKVKWENITFEQPSRLSCISRLSLNTEMSQKMESEWVSWSPNSENESLSIDWFPKTNSNILAAFYKGNMVAIKRLQVKRLELNRRLLLELKLMRETSHENLTRFVGACLDDGPKAVLNEYCSKGSLRDVLSNCSLNLDWFFRFSLINDIVSGLCYLHNSEHIYHGRLKSNNCLVDSRFCVKISDFGLKYFRDVKHHVSSSAVTGRLSLPDAEIGKCSEKGIPVSGCVQRLGYTFENESEIRAALYLSPDILLTTCRCSRYKSKRKYKCAECHERFRKGDVYSFGVVLQEIATRENPYNLLMSGSQEALEIVTKVMNEGKRPRISDESCTPELKALMNSCWHSEPELRPSFNGIRRLIRSNKLSTPESGISTNATLTERLLKRMEQYATGLESIVEQRTAELAGEKRKTEELLYQILPRSVANQLKIGNSVIPDYYDSVTIYFSDIVGFTSMCSESTPMQVVDFLNDLYTCFDSIISDFDVYKVETIGDAYMVVSGLPDRNGLEHAKQIAMMALKMLGSVERFAIRHRSHEKLKLRIGIHTGPCCAGVVGNKRPRYCLFGDTVNTASRMESTGEALKIHVSSSTKTALDTFGNFQLELRGETEVKGKGAMKTYWLLK